MSAKGEALVGIEEYITDTKGIGGRLRKSPEDFRVNEISLPPKEVPGGKWTIATVTANNWETNRLVRFMSKKMRIGRDRIRFAGTKDKRAVSTQLMAIKAPIGTVQALDLKDVEIANQSLAGAALQCRVQFGQASLGQFCCFFTFHDEVSTIGTASGIYGP